jgi:deazaflavin-dependent oxidoreductase (nitroreductase family)
MSDSTQQYAVPAATPHHSTGRFFNSMVAGFTKAGVSVLGSRLLYVRGRKSGEWDATPVSLLSHQGDRYLVAPHRHTQWVRNLRAAGSGELHLGKRVEKFIATEVSDAEKPEIIRAYLRRWRVDVGTFFHGVCPDAATDAELLDCAQDYPVFRVSPQYTE